MTPEVAGVVDRVQGLTAADSAASWVLLLTAQQVLQQTRLLLTPLL
jgi:hypothetical protein